MAFLKASAVAAVVALVAVVSAGAARQSSTPARLDGRSVALTFDDLPATHGDFRTMREVTEKLLQVLVDERVPAIGFVNERKLFVADQFEQRVALLDAWLDAGFELGNHTYSHIAIDEAPLDTYKADVIRGEVVTRRLLERRGRALRYFRHTQLRTGPTPEYKQALDAFLAERKYRVAPVTVDNNEFVFAHIYAHARAEGDRNMMETAAAAYVPYMEDVFAHFERLSREFLGYEVRQTLLLHANELNADHLRALLRMLRARGYRFITLDDALEDAAYALRDAQALRGLSWLHRWMLAEGLRMQPEPTEPPFIQQAFAKLQRRPR